MNRWIRYFCMVVIPLILSILIDYLIEIPDKLIIVLYVVFYGITSYLFGAANSVRRKDISKKHVILLTVTMLLSLLALILIRNGMILNADTTLIGIIQVMLSLLLSVSIVILLNIGVKRKISNSEDA